MAVGRNRSKIYAVSVGAFWVTVWAIVFTLPYMYYEGDLGPKTGFVYTGLSFITMAYVYFCVGEVTGRTMEEINGFFRDGIPARQWKHQPRMEVAGSEFGGEKRSGEVFEEKAVGSEGSTRGETIGGEPGRETV